MSPQTLPAPAVPPMCLIRTEGVWGSLYTATQMQAYGQACRDAALEEAAIESDKEARLFIGSVCWTLFELGKRIRSLK